ncbi:multicopper oxidase domain-containing protein, partial [Klebsiella pneumoniae]|nr:multicopper oxidase domain-containing protein [Klebsiella pneumoniae]
PVDTKLPEHLVDIPDETPTPDLPVRTITMDGMDDEVALDGKKFDMSRIDARQKVGDVAIWEIRNTNSTENGMVHPFHVHGTQFRVLA